MNHIGSPPHTWRILNEDATFPVNIRITSTYVENTVITIDSQAEDEDHLHIRGEYFIMLEKAPALLGSPPHTWRIRAAVLLNFGYFGITSTYVENTVSGSIGCGLSGDHLHIRGEYSKQIPL